MEQEIERRVLRVAIEQSEKMKEETGIETSLLKKMQRSIWKRC